VRGDGLAVGRDDPHVGRRRPERVEIRVQHRHGSPFWLLLMPPNLPLHRINRGSRGVGYNEPRNVI
jgi:hypothetical protein